MCRLRINQASFIRGGGGILDKTHPPNFGPTHRTFDPPRPPPFYNSVGAFFVNQIEAKALSFGIPAPKGDTPKLC